MPDFLWLRSLRVGPSSAAQFLVVIIALCSPLPALAQNASIGLYADASGNTCSFSGNAPGFVTAYVVIRPDAGGMTGVQFAAPVPQCFGGTFLYDTPAAGALVIGDSQTGVSVALSGCAFNPLNVLQITYQANGGTTPCCAYPVVADPVTNTLAASNCAFEEIPVAAVVSRFNADASCECHGNSAPSAPADPSPQDGTAGQSAAPHMSWFSLDIDGNLAEFDIYIGTTTTPPLVAAGLTEPNYVPALLPLNTRHYWRVVARDAMGLESSGPLWTFITRSTNHPPFVQGPSPGDGEANVLFDRDLSWSSLDIDGDLVTFDLYFGTSPTPPLVAEGLTTSYFEPGVLAIDTHYYWRVVGSDGMDETATPTWDFHTRPENRAPDAPFSPSPSHNATNIPRTADLAWSASDADGDPLKYDVYFGTTTPPPLVASNVEPVTYEPGLLASLTHYYWRIVARDIVGETTSGPTWEFTTQEVVNNPPNAPSNPSPPNNGSASLAPVLTWNCTDPNGDPIRYAMYFGTVSPPPLVATGGVERSYTPGTLSSGTDYYWRVEASDNLGATTLGPIWRFTTVSGGSGDVDNNGILTVDDARCAFSIALNMQCGGTGASQRAEVNCDGRVTPRDARCIHKNVLDGSCTFCGGGPNAAPRDGETIPTLFVLPTWAVGDTLITQVFVAGIVSVEAFGFDVRMDPNVQLVRAVRIGATIGFNGMKVNPSPFPGLVPARVGAYTTDSVLVGAQAAIVQLHFLLQGDVGTAIMENFVDDLAGAPPVGIRVGRDGPLPVFITRFDAVQNGDAVDVSWDFASDEPVDSYRLYRQIGTATAILIAQGDAAAARSFVDNDVQPSTTYRYELVVRTADGEEYRSQPATLTTKALTLALGQNHPNPFNPSTTIPFTIAADDSKVRLLILDASGRLVRTLFNGIKPAGTHTTTWDGRDDRGGATSSGVYFCVLDAGGERRTRKLVLLK